MRRELGVGRRVLLGGIRRAVAVVHAVRHGIHAYSGHCGRLVTTVSPPRGHRGTAARVDAHQPLVGSCVAHACSAGGIVARAEPARSGGKLRRLGRGVGATLCRHAVARTVRHHAATAGRHVCAGRLRAAHTATRLRGRMYAQCLVCFRRETSRCRNPESPQCRCQIP